MKFCKDCAHVGSFLGTWMCRHPDTQRMDGTPRAALDIRYESQCGVDAKLFEPIPAAPPPAPPWWHNPDTVVSLLALSALVACIVCAVWGH